MGFSVVDWSTLSEITSTKLKQMMDNDQYLKDQIDKQVSKVDYAKITSGQTGITNAAITGLSVDIIAQASHVYKITVSWWAVSMQSDAGEVFDVLLKEDGTQKAACAIYCPGPDLGVGGGTLTALVTPSAGSHTYTVWAERKTGTGTLTFGASATQPAILLIEDLSAA